VRDDMSEKNNIKSFLKEADDYRDLGLLKLVESRTKYLEILELIISTDGLSKDTKLIDTVNEKIGAVEDLLAGESQPGRLIEKLVETNNALSALARNIEMTQKEKEKAIVKKIRSVILPIIERLQKDQYLKRYQPELTRLNAHIQDLTTDLS
jgi:hypothetical protein